MNINEFFKKYKGKNILIVGIGNSLRGDDAAGLLLARKINTTKLNVICAETGLINYLGKIIDSKADIILIIDAVHLNKKAGNYKIFPSESIQSDDTLSHGLSFEFIKDIIKSSTHSKIYFLGIQPKTINIGENLTPPVVKTINELANKINKLI